MPTVEASSEDESIRNEIDKFSRRQSALGAAVASGSGFLGPDTPSGPAMVRRGARASPAHRRQVSVDLGSEEPVGSVFRPGHVGNRLSFGTASAFESASGDNSSFVSPSPVCNLAMCQRYSC